MRDSNSPHLLGRQKCYHYTNRTKDKIRFLLFPALPIELQRRTSSPAGLEPATRGLSDHALNLLDVSLEPYVGLEPTTFSMARRYATNCINRTYSRRRKDSNPQAIFRSRRISSPLPYQLGYASIRAESGTRTHEGLLPQFCRLCPLPLGFTSACILYIRSSGRTRTCDPHVRSVVL